MTRQVASVSSDQTCPVCFCHVIHINLLLPIAYNFALINELVLWVS